MSARSPPEPSDVASAAVYQPYAQYPSAPEPPPPVPPTVRRAVTAMYAGSAASVIAVAFSFLLITSIKNQVLRNMKPGPDMSAQDFANLQHTVSNLVGSVGLVVIIIAGLVDAGLWLWMAWKCKSGRSWARIVSTVFFGVSTLGTLSGLASLSLAALWSLVIWLIGLIAIVLLWQRPSTDFFKAAVRY